MAVMLRLIAGAFLVAAFAMPGVAQSPLPPAPTDGDFDPQAKPPELRGVTVDQKIGAQVPLDVALRGEDGEAVVLEALFDGRPVLLDLGYYECPLICPTVKKGIAEAVGKASRELGPDYRIISVSIDPDETPAVARSEQARTARLPGVSGVEGFEDHWRFLTGTEDAVGRIARAVGYGYRYLPKQDEFGHAPVIIFVSREGEVTSYLPGTAYPKRQFDLALGDAAAGRGGSIFEQVLQWCYRFDPSAGEYVVIAMNVMKLGGVVVLVAVAGTITGLFVWECRRKTRGPKDTAAPGHPAATA